MIKVTIPLVCNRQRPPGQTGWQLKEWQMKRRTMNAGHRHLSLVLWSFALGVPAVAQEPATLELRGAVALNCTLAATTTAKADRLDIQGGEKNALVGIVTENCNSGNGYTVQLSSGNAGRLVSAPGIQPKAYDAHYDNGSGTIAKEITAARDNPFFNRQSNLTVNFPGDGQAIAGEYADTVNLVIKAK